MKNQADNNIQLLIMRKLLTTFIALIFTFGTSSYAAPTEIISAENSLDTW